MARYDNRNIAKNREIAYYDYFQDRGINHIVQFTTPTILPITNDKNQTITRIEHTWAMGDKLWKLAQLYYGLPNYWWLIAWYNQKPTESHFAVGDIVYIPTPFERILSLYNRRE